MLKRFLYPGVLSLAAAVLVLLCNPAESFGQGRGSRGIGGIGYSYGTSPYYYSGYGYRSYSPYYYNSFAPGYSGYYRGYYPGYYGGYSYPGNYGYYNSNYYSNGYYASTPNVSTYQSYYPSEGVTGTSNAPAPDNRTVVVSVRVPADAEVWFGDFKTSATGMERVFVSPPLAPDQTYTYTIRARWNENSRVIDRTRNLKVRAGERLTVDFRADSGTE
jgi:uncharacterized protein (TIGR03000 family)